MAQIVRYILGYLFGSGFRGENLPLHLVIRCAFHQKILLNNHRVPWPVHWTSKVKAPKKIDRGNRYPGLGMGCHIDGRNGIKFGANVRIGPRCTIVSMNHCSQNFDRYLKDAPVVIGDDCWLGANSTILPGVQLAEHTIVAAGAVVTRSFSEGNVVLAGVPAKIVRTLPPYGQETSNES